MAQFSHGQHSKGNLLVHGKAVARNVTKSDFRGLRRHGDDNFDAVAFQNPWQVQTTVEEIDKPTGKGQSKKKQPLKKKGSISVSRDEKLQEIRSRVLARKYAHMWLQLTFGKAPPYTARKFFEASTMKRVFAAWKEEWWMARIEWKLDIRAECHNRYRLWLKVWQAWRLYVKLERNEKCLLTRAISLCNKKLLTMCFNGWKEYADAKKYEKQVHSQVVMSSAVLLKRRIFNLWLKRLTEKHQIAELESISLHRWAYNQLLKAWIQWKGELEQRVSLHQQMHVLAWNHQVRSLRTCWVGWSAYVEHRKAKKRNRGVADEQYSLSLMTNHFDEWIRRHRRVQEIAHFHEQLAHKERVARSRRAFNYWKHYVVVHQYYKLLTEISEEYHAGHLKMLVLCGFRYFVALKQQKTSCNLLAMKHRRIMLLSCGWNLWIKRCEHSEEIKMLPKSRLAIGHFRKVTLLNSLTTWKYYVIWRRHHNEQYSIADKHFSSKLLPKALEAFRQNVEIRHYKLQISLAASSFRRENLLSMVFYNWWRSYVQYQDVRMMERMAILHCEEVTKRTFLARWRLRTKLMVERSYLQEKADDHNYYRVLSNMLYQWKLFCQQSRHRRVMKIKADFCYKIKLLNQTWNGWHKYVEQQRRKHKQWQKACDHHSLTITKKLFAHYKLYHQKQLVKKATITQAISFYNISVLRKLCKLWNLFVLQQQELRSMRLQAAVYYNGKLTHQVWTNWRHATRCQVLLQQIQEKKVILFQRQLHHNQVARIFTNWRCQREQRVMSSLKWERSVCLHKQTVLHKYFMAWSQYHHLNLHKLSLNQDSSWFHGNRLKSSCYSQWRLQLMRVLIYRQKNTLALWVWSQTLQRKVIQCWCEYTKYRNQRQRQYNDAMQYYRKTLLHIGIIEWIKVVTWQAAQRQERALHRQTKNVQSTMLCVRRCAQHWRKWAHFRSLQRPRQPVFQQQYWNIPSSRKTTDEICTDWVDLVNKFNMPATTTTRKRPQPRKPSFLLSHGPRDIHSAIHQEHTSVPRKQVLTLSHLNKAHEEEFTFLPSSASEASLIPVNTLEEQQLLDTFMNDHLKKQPKLMPLPPSAFEIQHPDTAKESPNKSLQSSEQQEATVKLSGSGVKLKNLPLKQEILYIKRFLKHYHSLTEKLRIIEERIKHLKAENGPHSTLKQLLQEQASITSALELHKPLMLRMIARSGELAAYQ